MKDFCKAAWKRQSCQMQIRSQDQQDNASPSFSRLFIQKTWSGKIERIVEMKAKNTKGGKYTANQTCRILEVKNIEQ